MKRFILALSFLLLIPNDSFGFGEIFKVETTGTEFCGDYSKFPFNPKNNINLWVTIVSDSELLLSFTPDFQPGTFFPMVGRTYLTGAQSAAFVGGQLFVDDSFATIRGTATFNKFGEITGLTGKFIQSGVLYEDCFSSGTFATTKRLQ